MEYRKLGKTELELTVITFGAWAIGGWMWGGADKDEAVKAIHRAIELGITSIDTAPAYGQGHSEEIVGEVISNYKRDSLQILTKYGLRWDTSKGQHFFDSADNNGKPIDVRRLASKESVIAECEASLKRLKTDYIDLYQIHWPDPTTPVSETMEAVERLLEQGKIRAAGVCNYNAQELEEAEKTQKLASNQVPFSMVNRDIETDVVPYCLKNNLGILAYSPMQRGLLTGKMKPGMKFNEGDTRASSPFYKDVNIEKINNFLEKLKPITESYSTTPAQTVLNWTIQQPGITTALAGARNPQQVEDNARAASFNLSKDDISTINGYLEELNLEL